MKWKVDYKKIKVLRQRYGFSQQDIAEIIGTTQAMVSLIEQGKRNITIDKLLDLVEFFGVELEYFIIKKEE